MRKVCISHNTNIQIYQYNLSTHGEFYMLIEHFIHLLGNENSPCSTAVAIAKCLYKNDELFDLPVPGLQPQW